MTHLLELILAASIGWEIIRYLTPFEIPVRIAPMLVIALALALTFANQRVLEAMAAAAGVAIFNRITNASEKAPEVLSLRRTSPKEKTEPSRQHRIPGL